MSNALFTKALKGAGFSITTSKEGGRSFRDEHDDRTSQPSRGGGKYSRGSTRGSRDHWRGSNRGRRGNRGRGRPRGRGRTKNWHSSGESQGESEFLGDEDGDVDMESGSGRYTPYARPSYRQGGSKFTNSRNDMNQSGETWNKITIPNGRKHEQGWLLNRLHKSCEVSFQPVEFHFTHDNACFFVNDQHSANALRSLSGSITVRDGSKLFIQVRPCPPPKITSTDSPDGGGRGGSIDQDILKQSLDTRYDGSTNSLDLSNFYHDKVLNDNQVQSGLNKPWLLATIVKLIEECCPQLENLDLRSNRIASLDALKDLHDAAPKLSSLHLGENSLRHINELKKIKNLKELKVLVVDGNPLCDNYRNSQTGYVSDIRSIFPKLLSLDNCELPDHIGFDIPSSTNLPETKGSFIPDEITKKLVLPFVKQYFAAYDCDNRQKLLGAYDDDAVFSMCAVDFKKDRGNASTLLPVYRKNSRNIKFVRDSERRMELLKVSRLSVVAFLNDLPSTKHDLESLTVDVNFVQQACLGFTVCGLFKEGDAEELRAFTRAFIAVPAAGNSIAIVNDQLLIRSPTLGQREEFAKRSSGMGNTVASPSIFPVSATPVSSPNPLAGLGAHAAVTPQATAGLLVASGPMAGINPQQQELVTQFSTQSAMNLEWSFKALSENNWDYQKAAEVFKTLHAQKKIPSEAFSK